MTTCIVLHTMTAYAQCHRAFLRELLNQTPDLFAVVGVAPESWEDAMDWLCIELGVSGELPGAFCNTTSHPGETLADVLEFARQWCALKGGRSDVSVIEMGAGNPCS